MMSKVGIMIIGLVFMAGHAMASMAAATFKMAQGKQTIQVIIDKKVINTTPKPVVKLKGAGGTHQVKIRVYNDGQLYVTRQKIEITPGYKTNFVVYVNEYSKLEIRKASISPMYNSQYKRPDKFYNRRFYALLPSQTKKSGKKKDAWIKEQLKRNQFARKRTPFSLLEDEWLC